MNFNSDEPDFEMNPSMTGPPQDLVYQPPDGANFGSYPGPPQQTHLGGMTGHEQTVSWQQGHYMGAESGFISASTTQPSSITGHEDEVEGGCFTGPGSITGSSIYDLDSAHVSEVSSVHSLQLQGPFGSSDPESFIPQLVEFLCDQDQVVVCEFLHFVEKCVRKQSFFNAYIRSRELVHAIVQTLINATQIMANIEMGQNNNNNTSNNNNGNEQRDVFEAAQKRAKSASNILRAMVHRDGGDHRDSENQRIACQNIMVVGGIQPLTGLLACNLDRIMFNAITTIHSILSCLDQDKNLAEATKNEVRQAKGVEIMVGLLKRPNEKLLTILTDCLRILATAHQATKKIILERDGPTLLINILKQQSYKNLIMMTARLVKVLSVCPHNKPAIIAAGGMEALARHLQSSSKEITYHCVWTMRNLSDVATNISDSGKLATDLIMLLHHREEAIIICAAGIISNLTAINENIKLAICDANGMRELLRVVEQHGRNTELLEPAMCALRHLTNNHKKVDLAQRMFIYDLGGLNKISRWVYPNANRACLKPALGIIRNLAQKGVNHQILREQQVLHFVLRLLSFHMGTLMEPNGNRPVDGIRWEEITEACLSCIFYFAKDAHNRAIIRDRAILHHLKFLLGNNFENIVRLSVGILHGISTDMEGAFVIQSEGLADSINGLVHSRNERIASYATSIMYNLTNLQKEKDRGEFRPQQPQQNMQVHSAPDDKFSRGFGPDMGSGFDEMVGSPMHPMASGTAGGQLPGMGGPPPPNPGAQAPHSGSPHGFMDDFVGEVAMDMEGLMSSAYNSNFTQNIFE